MPAKASTPSASAGRSPSASAKGLLPPLHARDVPTRDISSSGGQAGGGPSSSLRAGMGSATERARAGSASRRVPLSPMEQRALVAHSSIGPLGGSGATTRPSSSNPYGAYGAAAPDSPSSAVLGSGDASFVFDDLLMQSERAMLRNKNKAADQLRSIHRVLAHADSLVADLDGGASAVANEGPSSEERTQAVNDILLEMMRRRGSYAEAQARAEGVLNLGPVLRSEGDEARVKECFFALARTIPSGNRDLDRLARELLTASTAEGIEVVHKYIFKGIVDTYSSAQSLTAAFGQAADVIAAAAMARGGFDDDSFGEQSPRGDGGSPLRRKSSSVSLSMQHAQAAHGKKMRGLVGQLRAALATLALCSSAGLDLCVDLRNRLEVNEASLQNTSKNTILIARHARQLQIENESLRAQVFMSGTTAEEQEVNATNIVERITSRLEAPRAIVMVQIENTQTLKLMRPGVVSEALLQVHQWVDLKLPQFKGRRVNYNSSNEPRDVFDAETNPYFAPESYAFEFASIGPAIEFCVCMQHELLYAMDWSPRLLRIRDFKEIKDAAAAGPPGENPSDRKRRLATLPPLWRGLRVRMAVHVGVPHVLRPFRKDIVENARRRKSIARSLSPLPPKRTATPPPPAPATERSGAAAKNDAEGGTTEGDQPATAEANPLPAEAEAEPEEDEEDLPDNAPHLAGAAMEITMIVLRRARGGEILLSPKANEAFDDLKFMYPDALGNVYKEERDYSHLKGPNTTASSLWQQAEGAEGGDGTTSSDAGGGGGGGKAGAAAEKGRDVLSATPSPAEEQQFLRATDRLWAIVSDVIKNRERPRAPFAYNKTFEVVFPPAAFWRMTEAAQQNLTLFAMSATSTAASRGASEALNDDDDDDDFTDASDEDDYVPADRIAAPNLLQIRRPTRQSVGGGDSMDSKAIGAVAPLLLGNVTPSAALLGPGANAGAMTPLDLTADAASSAAAADPLTAALATITGTGGGADGAGGGGAGGGRRGKRRTAAEYEEVITHCAARIDTLQRRLQQAEETSALYASEVQSTREQNGRLTERTRAAEKAVTVQKRLRFIYAQQTARATAGAMGAADRVSQQAEQIKKLQEDNASLIADVKKLEYEAKEAAKEAEARNQRHLTNKSVGTMTAADAVLVRAQEKTSALEAALRGVGSVLGAWVQHLDVLMKPPREGGGGGGQQSQFASPRANLSSQIAADLHQRMSAVLQDEAVGRVVATVADRTEGAASLRSTSTSSQLKSTKWDDLVRLSRQTLQQASSSVSPAQSTSAASVSVSAKGSAVTGGDSSNDTPIVDVGPALAAMSTFECIRNICGFMAKGIRGAIEYENLMSVRLGRLGAALNNANSAVEASLGGTYRSEGGGGGMGGGPLSSTTGGIDTDGYFSESNTDGAGTPNLSRSFANPLSATGGAESVGLSPLHLQRLRDAERRVREQDTMIAQLKGDAVKAGAESLIGEREVEVSAVRLKAMTAKAMELATALRNVRETVGLVLEKLQQEAAGAALVKQRVLKAVPIGVAAVLSGSMSMVMPPSSPLGSSESSFREAGIGGTSASANGGEAGETSAAAAADEAAGASTSQPTSPGRGQLSPRGTSTKEAADVNEYLLSKIFGDVQALLLPTVAEFCTSSAAAAGAGPKGEAGTGSGASTSRSGDKSAKGSGHGHGFFGADGGGALAAMSPAARAKALRTGNGMLSHEIEIQNILHRSAGDGAAGGGPSRDPTVGTTQLALNRLADDAARVSKLLAPLEARQRVYAEKEAARRERESTFEDLTWAPVVERTYKRERYLGDQVKYLKKRHEQQEADRRAGIERRANAETQTALFMAHRIFQRLDEAAAKGVDVDYADRERAKADKQQEADRLLRRLRITEGEAQTDFIDIDSHWTQTDARLTGLPPPNYTLEGTADGTAEGAAGAAERRRAAAVAEAAAASSGVSVGTMTDVDRTDMPNVFRAQRSIATMTDELPSETAEGFMFSANSFALGGSRGTNRMSLAPSLQGQHGQSMSSSVNRSAAAAAGAMLRGASFGRGAASVAQSPAMSSAAAGPTDPLEGFDVSSEASFEDAASEATSAVSAGKAPKTKTAKGGKEADEKSVAVVAKGRGSVAAAKEKEPSARAIAEEKAKAKDPRLRGFSTSKPAPPPLSERISQIGASGTAKEKEKDSRVGFNSSTKPSTEASTAASKRSGRPSVADSSVLAQGPTAAAAKKRSKSTTVVSIHEGGESPAVGASDLVVGGGDEEGSASNNASGTFEGSGSPTNDEERATRPATAEYGGGHTTAHGDTDDDCSLSALGIGGAEGHTQSPAVSASSPSVVPSTTRASTAASQKRGVSRAPVSGPQSTDRVVILPARSAPQSAAGGARGGGAAAPTPASAAIIFGTARQTMATLDLSAAEGGDDADAYVFPTHDGSASDDDGEASDGGGSAHRTPSRVAKHRSRPPSRVSSATMLPLSPSTLEGSLADNMLAVDRGAHGDRPRSGLAALSARRRDSSNANAEGGSRGLQGIIDLGRSAAATPAEEFFTPLPSAVTPPLQQPTSSADGSAAAAAAQSQQQPSAAVNARSMLARPYGATRKMSAAGGARAGAAAAAASVVQQRLQQTSSGALTAGHPPSSSPHSTPKRNSKRGEEDARRHADDDDEEASHSAGEEGGEPEPLPQQHGKTPTTIAALLLRSRATSNAGLAKGAGQPEMPSIVTRRGSVVPYTVEPPAELDGQYDMHRRFYERQSIFGAAAAQMEGLGADAYDRLLLRPVVTPESELPPAVARGLDQIREANKVAKADAVRVSTAHARLRQQQAADAEKRAASAMGSQPAHVAMQHVMKRPLTTPSPSRPKNPSANTSNLSASASVGHRSVLSAINNVGPAPAPFAPNASHPVLGGNGSSFMLPPSEPSVLSPVLDPKTGFPLLLPNEHGRPMTPVKTPKASAADAGDRVRVHLARHSKAPQPNAASGAAAYGGAASANDSTALRRSALPPRPHSSAAAAAAGQVPVLVAGAEGSVAHARSHTPVGKKAATQQRSPLLTIETKGR